MSNGWYPGATKHAIAPGANDPAIVPVMVILHVAVSNARSLWGFFNGPSGGIESHFYIRRDGTIEQYRSVLREADANYKANSWLAGGRRLGAVSIETQGFAGGKWTGKQIESIKAIVRWLNAEHGVPFQTVAQPLPPDLAHGGVSYHTRFKAWSNVAGKTCPGPKRIMQFVKEIRPWLDSKRNCLHCPVHCPKEF